jgi:hypothetical protein
MKIEDMYSLVIIPQFPTRRGDGGPEKMSIDLTDAERYGRVVEVLDPSAKPFDPSSIGQLDDFMVGTNPNNWLLCIGNPTMIAAAAGAFASEHGCLNLLQWQSRKRRYEAIRIIYHDEGMEIETVTLPPATPGEDDE